MPPSESTSRSRVTPEDLERLRALVTALVRDPNAADDVLQETWMAARRMPAGVAEAGQVRAWLRTTAKRIAGARRRSERDRSRREAQVARPEAGCDRTSERLACYAELIAALDELPEPYRTTVSLRYLDGLSPKRIARRLGRRPDLVRQHLHRGLERLRARLDARHGGGRDGRCAWVLALAPLRLTDSLVGGSAATLILGALLVKPLLTLLFGALLIFALWWKLGPSAAEPRRATDRSAVVAATPEPEAHERESTRASERASIAAPALEPQPPPIDALEPDATWLRVVDARTREPVPGARVESWSEFRPLPVAQVADGAGRVELRWPDGLQRFAASASAPGYGASRIEAGPALWSDGHEAELPLFRASLLGGVVVDSSGAPVEGAQVWLADDIAEGEPSPVSSGEDEARDGARRTAWAWSRDTRAVGADDPPNGVTAADGSFSVEAALAPPPLGPELDAQEGGFLIVRHPERGIAAIDAEDVETLRALGAQTARLELRPLETRNARVLDEAGRAVSGALVVPAERWRNGDDLKWVHRALADVSGPDGRVALPGSGSSATVEGFEPWLVYTFAPGFADARFELAELSDDAMLRLVPAVELTVQVFDEGGRPVSGLLVEVEPFGGKTEMERHTDAHGLARFPRLAAGTVEVLVKVRDTYLPSPNAEVVVPGPAHVVVLRRPVRFEGQLTGLPEDASGLRCVLSSRQGEREPERHAVEDWRLADDRYRAVCTERRADELQLSFWDGERLIYASEWTRNDAGLVRLDVDLAQRR